MFRDNDQKYFFTKQGNIIMVLTFSFLHVVTDSSAPPSKKKEEKMKLPLKITRWRSKSELHPAKKLLPSLKKSS